MVTSEVKTEPVDFQSLFHKTVYSIIYNMRWPSTEWPSTIS